MVKLYDIFDHDELKGAFLQIINNKEFKKVYQEITMLDIPFLSNARSIGFTSEDTSLLNELLGLGEEYFMQLFILDLMIIWRKKEL
ncbi:MAG: hypothetical protein HC831_17655 [Chloroflexia bacterium]|nr:hypothetical protein [Chloroflexia bacterium]